MPLRLCVPVFASLLFALAVEASEPPVEAPPTLAAVDVEGVMPGPGLWQVRREEHVLWLVGTLSPLPERMQWRSAELDARLEEADAILGPPGFSLSTGRGRLHALTLVPSMLGARKLPGRERLADVLSPELYARWSELKAEHLGRDRGVERWRPVFAAEKLHSKAVEGIGLSFESPVGEHISKVRKRRDLPYLSANFALTLDEPRQALRDFKRGELDDIECFERTLDRLESDLSLLGARAEAWAIGDVEALRALHDSDPASACIGALTSAPVLQQFGLDDVRAKSLVSWLEAAEQALAAHRTTVSAVSIGLLLDTAPDGLLATLEARGYRVLGPDDIDEDAFDNDAVEGVEAEGAPELAAD
ncbi:MAG: TraB/GumN family protein [Aquimonas sp.]|nr:TraB/GumN family protein [Aquimonas sp.]